MCVRACVYVCVLVGLFLDDIDMGFGDDVLSAAVVEEQSARNPDPDRESLSVTASVYVFIFIFLMLFFLL